MLSENREEFDYDGDWTEKFIQLVQSRPAIYNGALPEHSDRNLISRLWSEICEIMIPRFQDMTSKEKLEKVKDFQNKWRNLRTCFRRELKKQQETTGQAAYKRRKYVYYDMLLFLLPTLDDQPKLIEYSRPNNTQADHLEVKDDSQTTQTTNQWQGQDFDFNYTSQPSTSTETQQIPMPKPIQIKQTKKKKPLLSHEKSSSHISKQNKKEAIDEDKLFLLSLVPTFKKLSDVQKIDAKIEFLGILKRLTQANQGNFQLPVGGYQDFAGNQFVQQNRGGYSYSGNPLSETSVSNPAASDVSRPSTACSFEAISPKQELPESP